MVYARGIFSLLVLLVIVMGTLVVIDAPPVLAGGGVTPAQNCKKNCEPWFIDEVFPGPVVFFCVYRTCDVGTGQCHYDCYIVS